MNIRLLQESGPAIPLQKISRREWVGGRGYQDFPYWQEPDGTLYEEHEIQALFRQGKIALAA